MSRRNDPTQWMWARAVDLMDQAERMHRQFFRLSTSAPESRARWEPPVDLFEDEHEVIVLAAMPGVPADRVHVTLEPDALLVRGERPLPFAGMRHAVRQLEIPYGYFERRIPLPRAQFDAVANELNHGCLLVRLRKAG